MYSEGIYYEKV